MCGGEEFATRGIIPRAIEDVFKARPVGLSVSASFLEIYNETLIDLLSDHVDAPHDLKIMDDDATGGVQVKGLTVRDVASEQDALAAFFEGTAARAVAEHALNAASSRSHCVFTLHFARSHPSGATIHSKAHFVDLAGSERVSKTESSGTVLAEAKHINKSLAFLEQVVLALTGGAAGNAGKPRGSTAGASTPAGSGSSHIPYRSSKLTHVLKDALGGHARLRLLACVWPDAEHAGESGSTLRFATRMMRIQCTLTRYVVSARGAGPSSATATTVTPASGISLEEAHRLKSEVRALRRELAMCDALHNRSGVRYAPVAGGEASVIQDMVAEYLDAESSDEDAYLAADGGASLAQPAQPRLYQLHTWRQIRFSMRMLRKHAREAAASSPAPRKPAAAAAAPGKPPAGDADDTHPDASTPGTRTPSAAAISHADPAQRHSLASWQAGPGAALDAAYQAARAAAKTAKHDYKEAGLRVNALKADMDQLKRELENGETDAEMREAAATATKSKKQAYKQEYAAYQAAREASNAAKQAEDEARSDMMAAFDYWQKSQADSSTPVAVQRLAIPGSQGSTAAVAAAGPTDSLPAHNPASERAWEQVRAASTGRSSRKSTRR